MVRRGLEDAGGVEDIPTPRRHLPTDEEGVEGHADYSGRAVPATGEASDEGEEENGEGGEVLEEAYDA